MGLLELKHEKSPSKCPDFPFFLFHKLKLEIANADDVAVFSPPSS